jgi:hypothetical protein
VSISSKSTFQLGGACYSVPTRWARLHANVWLGVVDLRVECKGESIILNRIRAGQKAIQYRHYLPELAKKPQAVRQVAGELLKELGAPYEKLWRLLVDRHGPKDAARLLSGILGAIVEDGEEVVREALLSSLATDRIDLLALAKLHAASSPAIEAPLRWPSTK